MQTLIQSISFNNRQRSLAIVLLCSVSTLSEAFTYTDLHDFNQAAGEPYGPSYTGLLAQGRDGNLYGTAPAGGLNNVGGAFRITPDGKTFTKLHDFDPILEGSYPYGGLSLGKDGNFYGALLRTFSNVLEVVNPGAIFQMTPAGKITILHSLTQDATVHEGRSSYGAPVQGRDGNFYGTTYYGGNNGLNPIENGFGTVYKFNPATKTYQVIYHFDGGGVGKHGSHPSAPLIVGKDGNLYGTTTAGGTYNNGTVFKITPNGVFTSLYSFNNAAPNFSGLSPVGPVMQGTDGSFYGTTVSGGQAKSGTVYKLTPTGILTVLHTFQPCGGCDGFQPYNGLVQATDGNFYGTTNNGGLFNGGVIFKIDKAGTYTKIYDFDITHGNGAISTPFLHTNGKIYGLTGGGHDAIYSFDVGAPEFMRTIPDSGKANSVVGLLGNLKGTTALSFNGVSPANFTINGSGTFINTTVPTGPASGVVTATRLTGNLKTLSNFLVTPTLRSFSPANGTVGATVILAGISLSQTTSVRFGGNKTASFTVDNDGQVTATVPVGALTGRIMVVTKGGTAISATNFTVIP